MKKELTKYIKEIVKQVYPKQKLGDCYIINSNVAYFLYDLGYKVKIIQGRVFLDRPIFDEVLKENRPETKGITQRPDHIWIKVYKGKARGIYDFAKKVFSGAKVISYSKALDTLNGHASKLVKELNKNWQGGKLK